MGSLPWPRDALPLIAVAGRFPHFDREHEPAYQSATHALHLYDYPAQMRLGGERFELLPGDVTLTPALQPASYAMPRAGQHLCVHFWPAAAQSNAAFVALPLHLRPGHQRDALRARLAEIVAHHARRESQELFAARASALLLELLLSLAAVEPEPMTGGTHARRAVEAAASRLEQNPAAQLDVPALARRLSIDQNYLSRRFRERFGRTLQVYLLERRIELARQLLAATELSIKEVGARVGLYDAQHFNKQFRRLTGLSPSAFRALGP